MRTFIFEGVQDVGIPLNWGKFMVGVPDMEWSLRSEIDPDNPHPLLAQIGWTPEHIWVFDLQTGEAAIFRPGGLARADLEKHRIWVCPLFEMFLTWLYKQNIEALHLLPRVVELPDAQFSINGYRRLGPHDVSFTLQAGDVITVEWGDEPREVICEKVSVDGALIRDLTGQEAALLAQARGEVEQLTRGEEAAELPEAVPPAVGQITEVDGAECVWTGKAWLPDQTVRLLPADAQTVTFPAAGVRADERQPAGNVRVSSGDADETVVFPAIGAAETTAIEAAKED